MDCLAFESDLHYYQPHSEDTNLSNKSSSAIPSTFSAHRAAFFALFLGTDATWT